MKKSFGVLCLLLTLSLSACDVTNEATPGPDETVPPAAIAAVRQAFPTATALRFSPVEPNRVWQADFSVAAACLSVYVSNGGIIYEASQATSATDLPTPVRDYLQRTYPKGVIVQAGSSVSNGVVTGYKVSIQPDPTTKSVVKTLLFDATGKLEFTADPASGSTVVSYAIGPDDLPTAAKAALTGYAFVKGLVYTVEGKPQYHVLAAKNNAGTLFIFDAAGTLLKSHPEGAGTSTNNEKTLTLADLTAPIKDYLNQNHAGWSFVKGISRNQDGQITRYVIVFTVGAKTYTAEFDGEGKLLSIK